MADKIATTITYAASGSAVAFGLSANELGAIIGATVAVLSLFVNIYFKHQHLVLARNKLAGEDREESQEE